MSDHQHDQKEFRAKYYCEDCHSPLKMIQSAYGDFWGCTNYPDCKSQYEVIEGKLIKKERPVNSEHKCVACEDGLLRRLRNKGKANYFWSCSNYPNCKQTFPDYQGKPDFYGVIAKKKANNRAIARQKLSKSW